VLQVTPELIAFSRLLPYAAMMNPTYQVAPHLIKIADKLEAIERGEIKRLIINIPPRHGKSFLTSEYFPAWYLGRNPEKYMIAASYGQDLATDFGRKVRNQLLDPVYKTIFEGVSVNADSQSAQRFHTNKGGAYFALGAGGAITGRGAHCLLIDDPIRNQEDASSALLRHKLIDWYGSTAYTRLMPEGSIVLIQTRWHDEDLAGYILKNSKEDWEVLNMPAMQDGRALWPERYSIETLEAIRGEIGASAFASLYQQTPVVDGGNIFKLEWFRRFDLCHPPASATTIVHSWDTAAKDKQLNDPCSCTVWAIDTQERTAYLKEVINKRMEYPELKRTALNLAMRDNPSNILIEDASTGSSLIPEMRQDGRWTITPIKSTTSKETRAYSCTSLIEAKRVAIPQSAPWLHDYEEQLLSFPKSTNDDMVDSTSQFLNWWKTGGSEAEFAAYLREQYKGIR
jgi:predicted phage terminase large subunit-like protein